MSPTAKLRGRLARQLTVCITLVMLVAGVMTITMLSQVQREALEYQVSEMQLALGQEVAFHYHQMVDEGGHLEQFQRTVEFITRNHPQVNRVAVVLGNEVIAQSSREAPRIPGAALTNALAERTSSGTSSDFEVRHEREGAPYELLLPFVTQSGDRGLIYLSTAEKVVESQMRSGRGRLLMVVVALSLILGLALHQLLRRIVTRPLRRLAEAADHVASGDLKARVPPAADNEIGAAGRAVNAMADTLVAQALSLRVSEERHRALFQSASDACFVIDLLSARIVEVNDEATRLLRRRREDLVGRGIGDLVPAWERGALRLLGQQLAAQGAVRGFEELQVLGRDGEAVAVSVNARRLNLGQEALVFASVRDISEQRRAAQELQQQLRRVTALHAASHSCSTSLEPQQIHWAIFFQIAATMACDALLIEQWEPVGDSLDPVFLVDVVEGQPVESSIDNGAHPIADSPLAQVVRDRRPLRLHRRKGEAPLHSLSRRPPSGVTPLSQLSVPMVSGDEVLGVLTVQSGAEEAFSLDDMELLAAMANQAALAISNARLHQSTRRALTSREALNHIAKEIGATLDLRRIGQIVYAEVCRLFPTDSFFLTVIDPEASRDRLLLAIDTIDGVRRECNIASERPLATKHTGHIVRTRQPQLELREPDEIPDLPHEPYGDRSRRSASLMYVPLIARDRVVGVMSVQSYTHRSYTPEDLTLLQAIGDLTALALENARLYNDVATSEARHRALVENTNVSIILTDLEGHVVMWNRGAEQTLGHSPEEMLGQSVADLFADGTHPAERIDAVLRQQRTWTAEGLARHRDGSLREIVYSVAQVTDAAGAVVGRVLIASDLTEKKTLERALLQAQKMESIGTLAGGIAHDFNNLLTGILGYASFLQTQAEPGTRLSRDLDQIERAARRASELTQQLLAFSRKQLIRHQANNLNQVVDETVRLMERTLGKHIRIEVEKDPDLHVVETDPTQMQQVLMNLAINARDAMPSGGTLTLATHNCELDEAFCRRHPEMTPGHHVRVTVSDTGHGMDEETVARIFDPFFTTKPVGEGTGLGLAMVYGIVRSHGGVIEVESKPGEGATFTIYLPISEQPPEPDAEGPEEEEVHGGQETILLVDDEPMILRLGASILERYGYTVLTAPGGHAALNLYEASNGDINLVVADMVMPEMNGAELAERLRQMNPDCRILLSSGYALDQDVERLLSAGRFIGFLPKPYRMTQLVKHIRRALDTPLSRA